MWLMALTMAGISWDLPDFFPEDASLPIRLICDLSQSLLSPNRKTWKIAGSALQAENSF